MPTDIIILVVIWGANAIGLGFILGQLVERSNTTTYLHRIGVASPHDPIVDYDDWMKANLGSADNDD